MATPAIRVRALGRAVRPPKLYDAIGSPTSRNANLWLLLPISLLLILILVKPVPLIGGISDDYKYLMGARCLECLPTNHWERRFPIVWPTGIAIELFGQNLWSVMITPIIASITCVILLYKLVEKQWGAIPATIAASALVVTPIFGERAMRIGIDIIELDFLLAALFVLQRKKGHFWAGVFISLAVLCRPTQLTSAPFVALAAWFLDRAAFKWFVVGCIVPLLAESGIYLISTGDPFYSWKLSLHHVQVDQPFLSQTVDRTKSPILNPEYIGGWLPYSGFPAPWPVQGLLNLIASPLIAITLWSSAILFALSSKRIDSVQAILAAIAGIYVVAMVYVFAVDPRPRMFMPVIAIAAALIGSLTPYVWAKRSRVIVVALSIIAMKTAFLAASHRTDYRPGALVADKLLDRQPYVIPEVTRQRMALVRTHFPAGGTELLRIGSCIPVEGWLLSRRTSGVCIYRRSEAVPLRPV